MFNAALLRPGSSMGLYPQRRDRRDSMLDKFAANMAGFVRQRLGFGHVSYGKFIKQIDNKATGLHKQTLTGLQAQAKLLRRRLYSEGLIDELVVEAFALIREVAHRTLNMRHYDVQMYGGWAILRGMIAEMETGEGKTLTATLPACTAAFAGIPVHIVTVNDYLVTRDAEWASPIYQALGLTVGVVTEATTPEQRRDAYACDITYCTNKQLVFDYLKDRLLLEQENRSLHLQLESLYNNRSRSRQLLMRGLCFAIVDEADSILIDEARTPLIISSPNKEIQQEEQTYKQAIKLARRLIAPRGFIIREQDRQIELTEAGKTRIEYLSRKFGGVWSGAKRRENLVKQALAAQHLFILDKHYLVDDGKVKIIDEYSGRVMADRSWERGLQQMIEVKEGCPLSGQQETLARISYQKFFRRYLHLGGMTGTAHEVAGEFWSVYKLKVARIPTHKPVRRSHLKDFFYLRTEQKWQRIIALIKVLHQQRRPILIGTKTVAQSEHLSTLLTCEGLQHNVLNARQNKQEAVIISQAGQIGNITVATNMAGRGTDIKLADKVVDLGGLHVLSTERHEARRIDRQLFGRCGRQGDPGSFQTIISLEDDLFENTLAQFLSRALPQRMRRLPGILGHAIVWLAQKRTEKYHRQLRKNLLKQDDSLEDMLAFSGRGE